MGICVKLWLPDRSEWKGEEEVDAMEQDCYLLAEAGIEPQGFLLHLI